jgi:hypothetical protein
LYGISQNPDTNDYILIQKQLSGNKKIDNFIQEKHQEKQLIIKDHKEIVFEWIPYSQFNKIKEMVKNGSISVYSAIWKNGPLYWSKQDEEYTRDSSKEVHLKCLHNSQNSVEFVLDEV